jgi:hypothetical protein
MANNYETIRNMLMAAIDVPAVLSGKVLEVDTKARTCNIDIDGTTLSGVLLQPVIDNSTGIAIFPQVDAQALCLYNAEWDGWVLLQASDIDHIDISVGDTSLSVSTNGIVINNGNNGGLVNVNTLKSAFNAVVSDIAAIATALNSLGRPIFTTSTALDNTIEDNSVKH